jgi:hypothetical protein
MNASKIIACIAALVAFVAGPTAHAQLFRAYVSSTGLDTNPCTLQQPCRLLPAALTAVAAGGEIWMLDSANYNSSQVNITKSVSILAVPGALGSLVATGGGDAININAASVEVTLRNLVIVHYLSSANGINFVTGSVLNVSDCEIYGMQGGGIRATATGSDVAVRNTVVRGSTASGFFSGDSVVATLDRVHLTGNTLGLYLTDGSQVKVSDSVLAANTTNADVRSGFGTTRVTINRSVVTGGSSGITAYASASGAAVYVALSDNTITQNGGAVQAQRVAGATAEVTVDTNWITHNGIGIIFAGSPLPTIYTRGNNTMKLNTADVSGGSLTALAAQ